MELLTAVWSRVIIKCLAYGHFTPALAMPSLPTADFTSAPDSSPLFIRHGGDWPTPDLTMDQMRQLLAVYSPHLQVERMMEPYILAGMGLQDTIADTPSCQRLEETFREMGKENFDFRCYDTGHGGFPDDFGQEREQLTVENQSVVVHINEEVPPRIEITATFPGDLLIPGEISSIGTDYIYQEKP